ncbi:6-carboxyhexanoate--CoA ligase [Floricoccus penangensis]|uniref:6-carboxyhexanoate--CoA ligase n=1 Tax=Floricoccus penangensis TaxID=1859475 RepID=UPI0020409531|nr:6-carboxyhexanoate--CoA ligase [Floricoccus penangensis]URZ88252.1 6-carboxyhexanoate--CoA ligase [Floricoccus penangensis]
MDLLNLYSIKMRATKDGKHISGAEKIVRENILNKSVNLLITRAFEHEKGRAENINIKIEKVEQDEIQFISPLQVTTVNVSDHLQGRKATEILLNKLGLEEEKAKKVMSQFRQSYLMRGAIILDVNSLERLEPDLERGIRATYMDFEDSELDNISKLGNSNSHFNEAIVLASKVINAPNILAEICCSDDPSYCAGYIASRQFGYVRFPHMKELGDENGGRIFLYDGRIDPQISLAETIDFIENTRVLVNNNVIINEEIDACQLERLWEGI